MSEKLPAPDPARFPPLGPEYVHEIATSVTLGRIYFAGGPHPAQWNAFRWFGPTTARFDHQPPPAAHTADRGVMYLAPALTNARGQTMSVLQTCTLECFRDLGVVDTATGAPQFVLFKPARALRLLDLADSDWVTVAGGNGAISAGPRKAARGWARAIHRHYPDVDGVLYPSSNLPPARAIALWERASDALPARPTLHEPLSHLILRAELEAITARTGLDLLPGRS